MTMTTWADWLELLRDRRLPAAVVDLDALDSNIDAIAGAIEGTRVSLRVATKSVRHPWLLRYILERGRERGFSGLMTYSAFEVALLVGGDFGLERESFLMGYPVGRMVDARALAELSAQGVDVVAMIDSAAHLDLLHRAAEDVGTTIACCIDLDASLRLLGGRVHLGVRRSPVRAPSQVAALARHAATRARRCVIRGVMAYEAQIAAIRDHDPASPALDPIRRLIKARSEPVALARRREAVAALEGAGVEVTLVNGGGTGSLYFTAHDPAVTEVTAGSGFLCPHLFDGAGGLALQPASFFAVEVRRSPGEGYVTCGGGGYPASGGEDVDSAPHVHLPSHLRPLPMEGFGEVQTPLRATGALELELGDPVICRHAKAGELAERFNTFLLVRDGVAVEEAPTYRGLGRCFL